MEILQARPVQIHELGNLSNLQVLDLTETNFAEADLEIIKAALPSAVEIRI